MSKTTGVIIAALVITVVAIAIGYANLSDEVLQIKGTVSAQAAQADFDVIFTGNGVVDEETKPEYATVSVNKTSDDMAEFNVSGLQVAGDTVTATYTIKNNSRGIVANNVRVAKVTDGEGKHVDNEYITTTVKVTGDTTLQPTETTTVEVTTTLNKTPLTAQTANIALEILATPGETTVNQ